MFTSYLVRFSVTQPDGHGYFVTYYNWPIFNAIIKGIIIGPWEEVPRQLTAENEMKKRLCQSDNPLLSAQRHSAKYSVHLCILGTNLLILD